MMSMPYAPNYAGIISSSLYNHLALDKVMILDRYFKKKAVFTYPNEDLSLTIYPTIIASMRHEVKVTQAAT